MAKKHAGQCGEKLGAKKVTDKGAWRDYKTWKVFEEESIGDTLAKEKIIFRAGHLLLGGRDQQGKCFIMQIASSHGEWRGPT